MEDLLHERILVVKDFHIEKGTIFDQFKKTGKGIALLPKVFTLENYPGFNPSATFEQLKDTFHDLDLLSVDSLANK